MDVALVAVADHPADYAATPGRPGVAYAELAAGVPDWLRATIAGAEADAVLVAPHWGPNMARAPLATTRAAAAELVAAGATLVAGHSAHVFHGIEGRVLYDLGDFLDDYRRDRLRRNDLGIVALVTLGPDGPRRLEAVPLKLEHCHTRLATGRDARWVLGRLHDACAALGTDAHEEDGRLVITW
jgi:poly-gamma-glutamate synthesis protein (capsule biosynthesis protein)